MVKIYSQSVGKVSKDKFKKSRFDPGKLKKANIKDTGEEYFEVKGEKYRDIVAKLAKGGREHQMLLKDLQKAGLKGKQRSRYNELKKIVDSLAGQDKSEKLVDKKTVKKLGREARVRRTFAGAEMVEKLEKRNTAMLSAEDKRQKRIDDRRKEAENLMAEGGGFEKVTAEKQLGIEGEVYKTTQLGGNEEGATKALKKGGFAGQLKSKSSIFRGGQNAAGITSGGGPGVAAQSKGKDKGIASGIGRKTPPKGLGKGGGIPPLVGLN